MIHQALIIIRKAMLNVRDELSKSCSVEVCNLTLPRSLQLPLATLVHHTRRHLAPLNFLQCLPGLMARTVATGFLGGHQAKIPLMSTMV